MKRRHKEEILLNAATKIIAVIRKIQKEDEIKIIFFEDEIHIGAYSEQFGWEVLDKIGLITSNPSITWCIRKNDEDDLIIVLINELQEDLNK